MDHDFQGRVQGRGSKDGYSIAPHRRACLKREVDVGSCPIGHHHNHSSAIIIVIFGLAQEQGWLPWTLHHNSAIGKGIQPQQMEAMGIDGEERKGRQHSLWQGEVHGGHAAQGEAMVPSSCAIQDDGMEARDARYQMDGNVCAAHRDGLRDSDELAAIKPQGSRRSEEASMAASATLGHEEGIVRA